MITYMESTKYHVLNQHAQGEVTVILRALATFAGYSQVRCVHFLVLGFLSAIIICVQALQDQISEISMRHRSCASLVPVTTTVAFKESSSDGSMQQCGTH